MFSFNYKNAYPDIINQQPKSSLGYKTNNIYPSFPPLMKDGRSVISSWDTETSLNRFIKEKNDIRTNWEYRRFLTKNAVNIMETNFNETANDTGSAIKQDEQRSSNAPFLYGSIHEKAQPTGFESSDLKEIYLSREQLYSRKCVPTIRAENVNV
jgi:hypothetical protein